MAKITGANNTQKMIMLALAEAWRGLAGDLVERPRKPAPKEVLRAWAREWAREGVKVDWQELLPPEGFVVLPRRWVVEIV